MGGQKCFHVRVRVEAGTPVERYVEAYCTTVPVQ